MQRTYVPVFDLTLKNSFYTDGLCPDFDLKLSPETADMFRRYRVRMRPGAKTRASSFVVFQEADKDKNPFVEIPDGTKWVFYLCSTQSLFKNFTDMPSGMEGDMLLYFKNRSVGNFLHPDQDHITPTNNMEAIKVRRRIFEYSFSSGSDTAITLKVMEGSNVKKTILLKGTSGNFQQGLELDDLPKGRYEFKHFLTSEGTPLTGLDFPVYLDETAVQLRAMAVCEIEKTSSLVIQGKKYIVDFLRRQDRWKYFVVIKNDTVNTYNIVDGSSGGSLVFEDKTTFITADTLDDLTRDMLEAQTPGSQVKLFISTTEIPYQENAIQNINLTRKKGTAAAKTVITHLPAPPLSNPSPEAVVCVVKPQTLSLT